MKIKITSDSTCDLSEELLERYHIETLPLSVTMGEDTFLDGVNMEIDMIYDYVESSGELPKTSAVNIAEYMDAFTRWTDEGYEVVHFCLGSGFSSTYQNACIAAEEVGHVHVIDSQNLSTGQGLLVLKACDMVDEGKSAEEIAAACEALIPKVETSFLISNLDYLYKGGRCSAVAAFGANVMQLKPCIILKDGAMSPGKKYRGSFEKLVARYAEDRLAGRTAGDIDTRRVFVTHTRCSEECIERTKEVIEKILPETEEILVTTAGATVTTHCGPNCLGVLFIGR